MFKLLALDLDGTTLTSEKKITVQTADAINKLSKSGVHVVVASGRCLAEIADYKNEFANIRYMILINGDLIYDLFEDKPIFIHPVPFEDCIKLMELAEIENAMIHLVTIHDSIANPHDIENIADFGMGVYYDMFNRICVKCENLKKYAIEHKEDVMKVNIYHRSVESRERTVARLKDSNLQLVYAESYNLETSPFGITKASGLIELCNYLKINIADTIAIGDAPNDIELLKTAGYSVAMGNAIDEVKQITDFITTDNDHDGVLYALNHIYGKIININ